MKNFLPLAAADPWPTWDNQINSSGRFQVLSQFDGEAVFDKETGLVWEQAPDPNTRTWIHAQTHCYIRNVGGRKGWRLPTVEELASLVDPEHTNPALPLNHPFSNVQLTLAYWSATTSAELNSNAWHVSFGSGAVGAEVGKAAKLFVWCVRGGHGYDVR
jgi:hypothetical protein